VGISVTEGAEATVSYTLWHGNGTDIAGDGVITHTTRCMARRPSRIRPPAIAI
jgi:hypothetical protein